MPIRLRREAGRGKKGFASSHNSICGANATRQLGFVQTNLFVTVLRFCTSASCSMSPQRNSSGTNLYCLLLVVSCDKNFKHVPRTEKCSADA